MSLLTILMSRCIPCRGRVQADISVTIRVSVMGMKKWNAQSSGPLDAVIDGVGDVDLEVECTVIRSAVVQHMVYWFICINDIRRIERCLMGLNEYGDQLFSRPKTYS
ncbi:hypothetical protein BDB01DRAFT_840291 [Pilobolus umbonatus]|nr:hypothetical protein BDB01DRAFT_840291 [Pilobolus umbonatus]